MAKAEGMVLEFVSPESIRKDLLETFPYEGPSQEIEYTTEEFSAVCPFSGLPDFGRLSLQYVPNEKIVELKSFKYYLVSYRNVGIYQEHATAKLFEDLSEALQARWLRVELVYRTRGGIDTTTVVDSRKT